MTATEADLLETGTFYTPQSKLSLQQFTKIARMPRALHGDEGKWGFTPTLILPLKGEERFLKDLRNSDLWSENFTGKFLLHACLRAGATIITIQATSGKIKTLFSVLNPHPLQ